MKIQFERRLRRLEGETKSIERLNFRNVSPDDLARMKNRSTVAC
jgi:hypothetical protein